MTATDAATVGELLLAAAYEHGETTAFVDGGDSLTYRQAAAQAATAAARLVAAGVRPGDRVALALANGWRYACAYFGVQLAGATAVLVNTRFTMPEIRHVLSDSDSRLVVTDAGTSAGLPPEFTQLDATRLCGPGGGPAAGTADLPGLREGADRVANMLYTSGTTGHPKGVLQTHANLLFNARQVGRTFGLGPTDRTLVVAPMFHATGTNSQLLGFVALGGSLVFQPRFSPEETLELLGRARVTFFAGVAAMLQLMLDAPAFDATDLSALHTVCLGGSPVPRPLLVRATARMPGVRFANVWGLTEATSMVTCCSGREFLDRPWSVGRALEGLTVAVAEGDRLAGAGGEAAGELWVRGPAVTAGYWRQPSATAATFRSDGWLRTGDVGRIDRDGYVQVLDRLKDMIVRGGENVYSVEVENVLARHPNVAEVAVVAAPDTVMGERVRAVVVPRTGTSLTLGELRRFAEEQLADYKLPAELTLVDELPRNPNGKVLKRQLSGMPAGAAHGSRA